MDGHEDFYKLSLQALVHHWSKCTAGCGNCQKIAFVADDFLYQVVLLCCLSVVVFVEKNRKALLSEQPMHTLKSYLLADKH